MIEQIVDYAMPCMNAERALKRTHDAVLARDLDQAISEAIRAVAESRLLVVTLKEMKERQDAIRQ
jgi:hypothetical protein